MPSVVRARRPTEGGKDWKVVDLTSGQVLAECTSWENARRYRQIHDAKERQRMRRKDANRS